ncbi:hypothetical protein ACEG43_41740 [Streptomyces aureus]|uniref:Uncharacterized protein n=1 Tax=Streptomyces aureus TaxID=193461 RepID=A0ABV4SYP3_9ACTN
MESRIDLAVVTAAQSSALSLSGGLLDRADTAPESHGQALRQAGFRLRLLVAFQELAPGFTQHSFQFAAHALPAIQVDGPYEGERGCPPVGILPVGRKPVREFVGL